MKREQISQMLNSAIKEVVGESALVNEDLSNIVTIGSAIPTDTLDAIFNKIINKVGNTIIESKTYTGNPLGILMSDWEYGSILEKIRIDIPETENNDTWSLVKGTSYDCFKFSPPTVRAKYFNKAVTFEIAMSFTVEQMKDSFRNADTATGFWNAVENAIRTSMTANTEMLEYRAVTNMIALKIHNNNNVINLLAEYKTDTGLTDITTAMALNDPEFLRYSAKKIAMYSDYIKSLSMLYNNDGYITHTADEDKRLILLSDFAKSVEYNLYSTTFNDEFVKIGNYTTVPYWQGSGTARTFANNSKIDLSISDLTGEKQTVQKSGIVGVLFDVNGCCVCRKNYRVLSMPVPKGEFINYWYKFDAMYMNDTACNFIVFTIEDGA